MKHALSLVFIPVVVGLAHSAHAQPVRAAHLIGQSIGGHTKFDTATNMATDTVTLMFKAADDSQVYTIDFVARHQIQRPVTERGVVDIIVTHLPREDDAPEMTLRVDGETLPLAPRLHSRRSVVASIPLNDLDRITSAGKVVDQTFDTELEFSPGQVKMLRHTADRWLGRVR